MICETCHGTGRQYYFPLIPLDGRSAPWHPCPTCGGCARQHCCDGLREQPEPKREDDDG